MAATVGADAVVLVNSSSARYQDFKRSIQPYLDNFGVAYTVFDIATNAVGTNVGNYAVIIVGHSQLDINHAYLDATGQRNVLAAVTNGTGLVNFDDDLTIGGTNRYDFVRDIFGFSFGSATAGTNVTFPATEPQSQMHYITARHQAGSSISLRSGMSVTGVTVPTNVTAVALSSGQPLLVVKKYGQGRAVQWASYNWMSLAVLGPIDGLDDLVWRGLVWAARKPFVMRGLPNFITMRLDDVSGPFDWVHIANEMGFKPWLSLFLDSIDDTEALDLQGLVAAGNATTSIHSFNCCSKFFYWNDTSGYGAYGASWPDSVMATNIAYGGQWHTNHSIPISKLVIPHYGEIGLNALTGLRSWGVEFLADTFPDQTASSSSHWLAAGPYRLYDSPGSSPGPFPAYYADFFPVAGHPEFNNQFFYCVTEISDDSALGDGDWCPTNDVPATIDRGTRQLKRALDSMALATLFSHEWFIRPIPEKSYITPITTNNWRAILQGITNNLAAYSPVYVTLDYACQYLRATRTSRTVAADYDPASGRVTATLTGGTDMDMRVYVYVGEDSGITTRAGTVPAFSGSTTVTAAMVPPPALTAALTPTNTVVVSWSNLVTGFLLKANPDLGTTNWSAVTNPPQGVGGQLQVEISPTTSNQFYRLVRP